MPMLGFNSVLENAGQYVPSNDTFKDAVDVENGGVEEAMEECALAVHKIFESMYDADKAEIEYMTESYVMEADAGRFEKLKNKIVNSKVYEVMRSAVMKVINGFINLVNKLKFDGKRFVNKYAKQDKVASVTIKGYDFPSQTKDFSLSVCFTQFSGAVGGYGPVDFATRNNGAEDLGKLFNQKKEEGLKKVKEYLGGDDFRKAAFGEKKDVTISTKEALVQIGKVCDQRLADLKKQKSDANKAFDQCIKSLRGMESVKATPQLGKNPGAAAKAPALFKPFAAAHNAVKSLYVNRLSVEIKATKARRDMYIAAVKKAVSSVGKKSADKKEESK